MRSQAERAAYVLLYSTMELGYFVSQPKSTLFPVQRMVHLGFGIDSREMAYFLPDRLRQKFRTRREELLESKMATEKQIQSFIGKCNHLRSVFAASSLFTFHNRQFVSTLCEVPSPIPQVVLEEIRFWSFVDSMTDPIPFRFHQHIRLQLFTDASNFGYGVDVSLPSGRSVLRDYWSSELLSNDICVKEALAVLLALQALPESVRCRRLDVHVDNEGLFHAWCGLKASSLGLVDVLKQLFLLCVDLNVDLRMHWVPSGSNPADAPSRVLSRLDCMLSDRLRLEVWKWAGPFSWDLMALPSNAFRLPGGSRLPFFSPFPVAGSAGVNVFSQRPPGGSLYCYPPFVMIPALIGLLCEWGDVCVVLILPFSVASPAIWFPRLAPFVLGRLSLASASDRGALLFPSPSGFQPNHAPLGFDLFAFRCFFPPRAPLSVPLPPPSLRVLVVSDSMFRPLSSLTWPIPFSVQVFCLSGGRLGAVLSRLVQLLSASSFDACLFHGGVNDISRNGLGFESALRESCSFAASALSSFQGAIFCSSVCQTRSSELNVRVCVANGILRSFSESCDWHYISHDNVRISDLADEVHLNAAGVAKIYRHITFAFRFPRGVGGVQT